MEHPNNHFTNHNLKIEVEATMTTYICFLIAMIILYIMKLLSGGFNLRELIAFFLMMILLGSHVYLSTRKRAIWGIVVPAVLMISFYPVYNLISPNGTQLIALIAAYVIAIGCSLFVWYQARKNIN